MMAASVMDTSPSSAPNVCAAADVEELLRDSVQHPYPLTPFCELRDSTALR